MRYTQQQEFWPDTAGHQLAAPAVDNDLEGVQYAEACGLDGGMALTAGAQRSSSPTPAGRGRTLTGAKASFRVGAYSRALSLAVQAVAAVDTGPIGGCSLQRDSLHLVAQSALLMQSPSRALKYASRLVMMDPKEPSARSLVRICTLEMEHEARSHALQEVISMSAQGNDSSDIHRDGSTPTLQLTRQEPSTTAAMAQYVRIHALLEKLVARDVDRVSGGPQGASHLDDVGTVMDQLTLEASQSVDSQIAFNLLSGYPIVISFFATAPEQVEELLLAVGSCNLYRARSTISNDPTAGLVRVRWPQAVLQRLTSLALDWQAQPDLATRSMGLLAFAAQDKLQRHTAFVAPPAWQPGIPLSRSHSIHSTGMRPCTSTNNNLMCDPYPLQWIRKAMPCPHASQSSPQSTNDVQANGIEPYSTPMDPHGPASNTESLEMQTSTSVDSPTIAVAYQTCPAALGQLVALAQQAMACPDTPQRLSSWSEPGQPPIMRHPGVLVDDGPAQVAVAGAAGALSVSGCEVIAPSACPAGALSAGPQTVSFEPFRCKAAQAYVLGECGLQETMSPRHSRMSLTAVQGDVQKGSGQESILQVEQLSLGLWNIQERSSGKQNDIQSTERLSSYTDDCTTPVDHHEPNPFKHSMTGAGIPLQSPTSDYSQPYDSTSPPMPIANSFFLGGHRSSLRIPSHISSTGQDCCSLNGDVAPVDTPTSAGAALHQLRTNSDVVTEAEHKMPSAESVLVRLLTGLISRFNPDPGSLGSDGSRGSDVGLASHMPLSAACCAALILYSFTKDAHSTHFLAATEQSLAALLALYQALHTVPPTAPAERLILFSSHNLSTACAWGTREVQTATHCTLPCCGASRLALQAMSNICESMPAVAVNECFPPDLLTPTTDAVDGACQGIGQLPKQRSSVSLASMSSRGSRPSTSCFGNVSGSHASSQLLSAFVQQAKVLVSLSPAAVQPELGWDGTIKGSGQGKQAVCMCYTASSFPTAGTEPPDQSVSTVPTPLQVWMRLFGHLASSGRSVARALFRAGLTDVFQDVVRQFRGNDMLVQATEHAWGNVCSACGGAMNEVLDEGYIHGLIAVAMQGLRMLQTHWLDLGQHARPRRSSMDSGGLSPHATPRHRTSVISPKQQRALHHAMSTALQALDKLAQLLNQCNGAEFLQLIRTGGVLPLIYWLLVLKRRTSPGHPTPSATDILADSPPGSSPPSFSQRSASSTFRPPSVTGPMYSPMSSGRGSRPTLPGLPSTPPRTPAACQHSAGHWSLSPQGSVSSLLSTSGPQHPDVPSPLRLPPSGQRSPKVLRSYSAHKRTPAAQLSPQLAVCIDMLPALCDASRCVLLGCLERGRRAACLGPNQVPRIGWFGELCPKELLLLEQTLRAQWADALLPPSNASSAPSTPACLGEKHSCDVFAHWTPTASSAVLRPTLDVDLDQDQPWTPITSTQVSHTGLDTPTLGQGFLKAVDPWAQSAEAQHIVIGEVYEGGLQAEASIAMGIALNSSKTPTVQ